MDTSKFFHQARQIAATFPEGNCFYISSTDFIEDGGREGQVCEATRKIASERIAAKTHRLAKPEEIEQFKKDQETRRQRYVEADLRNQKQATVVLSESASANLSAQMAAALIGSQSAAAGGKGRSQGKE